MIVGKGLAKVKVV